MKRWNVLAAALAATLGLAAAGCGGDDETSGGDETEATETEATETETDTGGGTGAAGELTGSVGPGFEISMEGTDGAQAGEATLTVNDQSAEHNFHLTGPGVDVMTEVSEVEEETFTINLQDGEYRFVCDPHASTMNGSFTVGG